MNINGTAGALAQEYRAKSTYIGAYAEDALDATKDLTIVIGGRWDHSSREATIQNYGPAGNPFDPTIASTPTTAQRPLRHFDALNPKLGFVYRTTPSSQLYFNASRSYEAPLNVELLSSVNANGSANTGFLNLDAQRAWQFELGHRGTSADKRYSWDVTVYDLEMQKELLASVINNQDTFQNAGVCASSPNRWASASWTRHRRPSSIQFVPDPPIDPMKIITLIQSKRHIKMSGQDKLRIELKYDDLNQRVLAIRNFFNELK